jgi:hypothetical protein
MRVYLDDVRNPPLFDTLGKQLDWVIVRTASECIDLIKSGGVEFISFDHDLGNDEDGTGYDVAKFIEKSVAMGDFDPINYSIHSANPVGANNIDCAMKSAFSLFEDGF